MQRKIFLKVAADIGGCWRWCLIVVMCIANYFSAVSGQRRERAARQASFSATYYFLSLSTIHLHCILYLVSGHFMMHAVARWLIIISTTDLTVWTSHLPSCQLRSGCLHRWLQLLGLISTSCLPSPSAVNVTIISKYYVMTEISYYAQKMHRRYRCTPSQFTGWCWYCVDKTLRLGSVKFNV